jgi:hypothetical protein
LLTRDDEVEDDVGDRAVASGADVATPFESDAAVAADADLDAGEQAP